MTNDPIAEARRDVDTWLRRYPPVTKPWWLRHLEALLAHVERPVDAKMDEAVIERAAMAMWAAGRKGIPWAKVPATMRAIWKEYARAALTAFLESDGRRESALAEAIGEIIAPSGGE